MITHYDKDRLGRFIKNGHHSPMSLESRQKVSYANSMERNWNWKGDAVGYQALHQWARKYVVPKPTKCPKCHRKNKLDICNISYKYRRILSDWEYLCRKCHIAKDGHGGSKKAPYKKCFVCGDSPFRNADHGVCQRCYLLAYKKYRHFGQVVTDKRGIFI